MDQSSNKGNISFLWWNTNLSPAGKSRTDANLTSTALAMIDLFINEIGIDLIALGEINNEDIIHIEELCKLSKYALFNGNEKAGRAHFDTCVIYNPEKLLLAESNKIVSIKGRRTLKVAQRLDFLVVGHTVPMHVFISHWPSRLHMQANAPERARLALRLRDSIEEVLTIYKEDASIVLMGDYNDEPFDLSLSNHLMATRDRELASRASHSHLLYNPFWQKIGHPHVSATEKNGPSNPGTYYHKQGHLTKWLTFDQIIFSSKFLGRSNWKINENLTQILDVPSYRELVLDPKFAFDHFPVTSMIEEVA